MGDVSQHRRRLLRSGVLLAGAGYLAGCGMPTLPFGGQSRPPRVGMLKTPPEGILVDMFREGMREHGYVEGQNWIFDYRFVEPANRLPEFVAVLAKIPVDVMICPNNTVVNAVRQVSTTIPIVFMSSNPVAFGYVQSLARPGGNLTGTSQLAEGMTAKRLQLLQETQPSLRSIGALVIPNEPSTEIQYAEVEVAAPQLGLRLMRLELTSPETLQNALNQAVQVGAESLFLPIHPFVMSQLTLVAKFATQHRLPAIACQRLYADMGGLMGYGASMEGIFKRAAYYVHRILKGDKPADLPVEQPTHFELVINRGAGQAIGLTIPPTVLQQANEIVE